MIRFHFFWHCFKQDVLEIWQQVKPRRYVYALETTPVLRCTYIWLWFALVFERDIRRTKWRNLYKETTE
jgi:hypothetical protein